MLKEELKTPEIIEKYIFQIGQKYTKKPIKVVRKSESKLMRFIGFVFRITKINPKFIEDYYTTLGNTIYVPDIAFKNSYHLSMLSVIIHECIHIKDHNRFGLFYIISYGAPQIFALLSFLSVLSIFFGKLWLLWLLTLVFAAPIPAWFRYYWELRAYRTSFVFSKHVYNDTSEDTKQFIINSIISQLTTRYYYFTWPFPKWMAKNLKDMSFMETKEYQEIAEFLDKELKKN